MKKIIRLAWSADGSAQIAEVVQENNQKFYVSVQFGASNGLPTVSSDANFSQADFEALGDINSDETTDDFRSIRESLKTAAKFNIDLV